MRFIPQRFIPQLLWVMTGTIVLTSLPELATLQSQESPSQKSPTVATAQARSIRYVPPGRKGAPTKTLGGGSRNCNSEVTSFTLLAPPDHVGLTTQSHPKFMWYNAADSVLPMQLTIVEPGMSEPLWTQELPAGHAGLNEIQLPENIPALVVGRRYRWSLSRLCGMRRSNDTRMERGWIERVAVDPVKSTFTAKTSIEERANAYAEAGLWYDAIAQAASIPTGDAQATNRMTPQLLTLLKQGGIKTILQQEQKRAQAKGTPRYDSGIDLNASQER
jgi:Domain of Unknown Function (DUF928)